jgi:hypothetical protein
MISKEILYNSTIGNARILTNSVFKMAHKFNQYCLSDEEIGLFCAIIIISPGNQKSIYFIFLPSSQIKIDSILDRHGLKNPDLLKFIQNKLKIIFGNMLTQHFSQVTSIQFF